MTEQLLILGAGGDATDVLDIVEALRQCGRAVEVRGLLDDVKATGATSYGVPIIGRLRDAARHDGTVCICSIRGEKVHATLDRLISSTGLGRDRFVTLIDPRAAISRRAEIGVGSYVVASAAIAGSASIGDHVAVTARAVVGHDARVDSFATLAPGAIVSGRVHVGTCCYIGAGAMIRQAVTIGARALVGMGAVVLRDVRPGAVVVGNPARELAR